MSSVFNDDVEYGMFYEGFIENLKKKYSVEIDEDDIHWRGFYSQGDGLCFDFEVVDEKAVNFLGTIESIMHLEIKTLFETNVINSIAIKTIKNHFANHYCHSQTRNIEVKIEFTEEDDLNVKSEQIENLILSIKNFHRSIADDIKNWYNGKCNRLYSNLQDHYEEERGMKEDMDGAYGEQEDMTISDKIDSMIDPEMNIEKVVMIIGDAKDLSYTKSESINLIETFIKNFNDDYMIIKKVK